MAAEQKSLALQVAENPLIFATGVGVANGVLAAARAKPVSVKAAAVTAGVIAAGEVALVYELPDYDRPRMTKLFAYSVLGTFLGLAPFISWKAGQRSLVQRAGESLARATTETVPAT